MTVHSTKVMITLPPALLADIDEQAAQHQTSRSGLIRLVLERYLAEQRRSALREQLKEGYIVNYERDRQIAEEFAHADYEATVHNAPWDEEA